MSELLWLRLITDHDDRCTGVWISVHEPQITRTLLRAMVQDGRWCDSIPQSVSDDICEGRYSTQWNLQTDHGGTFVMTGDNQPPSAYICGALTREVPESLQATEIVRLHTGFAADEIDSPACHSYLIFSGTIAVSERQASASVAAALETLGALSTVEVHVLQTDFSMMPEHHRRAIHPLMPGKVSFESTGIICFKNDDSQAQEEALALGRGVATEEVSCGDCGAKVTYSLTHDGLCKPCQDRHCDKCGAKITSATDQRTGGLCMPCHNAASKNWWQFWM